MGPTSLFDVLEPRALLSAPVAAVQSFAPTVAGMSVVVRYTASAGIDPASISYYGLGATGPGVSRFSSYATVLSQQPTQTTVRYDIICYPYSLWPNGTYNLGIPAGAVRSRDGLANAAAAAGSYWIWVPDNVLQVAAMGPSTNSLALSVQLLTRNPGVTLPVSVKMIAPDGTERVQTGTIGGNTQYGNYAIFQFQNTGERPFDYTDPRGTYVAALGDYDGDQLVGYHHAAQAWWWFSAPKVEFLSTSVTDSVAQLRVRVSGEHGVDLASMRGTDAWQNVTVTVGNPGYGPAIPGSLTPAGAYAAPLLEPQSDGSVIATYSRAFYRRNFTNTETGEWTYSVSAGYYGPRDIDGHQSLGGVLWRESHVFTTIAAPFVRLQTNVNDARRFLLTVDFSPANTDTTMFGDGDVRLDLAGQTYQLTLAYGALTPTNTEGTIYRAYFVVQLAAGETLHNGTANIYLNAGAVTTSGLPSSETFLGSWWLWFN